MPPDRDALKPSSREYFRQLDAFWAAGGRAVDPFRNFLSPAERALKARRYRGVIAKGFAQVRRPLDRALPWDQLCFKTFGKLATAALVYEFARDPRALPAALDAVATLEACERRFWTYSSCLGILDMDLRTAEAALCLAQARSCFGDALDAATRRRLSRLVLERCLTPGLDAERRRLYPWMESRANWRVILCGCFAMAGMVYADEFPDHRELIEYGLEGVLVALEDGDRAGGWDEGPGYWDYGLSYAVRFAFALRQFTGGAVDLFRHPFLRRTGDFRVYLQPTPGRLWNWSDASKAAGSSNTIVGLARAYGDPVYQREVFAQGVKSIGQVYLLDPNLHPARPAPPRFPLAKLFPGPGALVLRGGFGPRDPYLGLKGGSIPHLNYHSHLDAGSLVIHAAGRELLAELEKWSYPYEGDRRADGKKSQPGFYDEDLQRWKRRDFDDVGALAHNLVVIEGEYPQPRTKVPARFLHREHTEAYDVAVLDTTAYYRPLATRVRRYLVWLRPDVALVVDEVRARRPVQARVLYHYLPREPKVAASARVTTGADSFIIANGPARLWAQSLHPARADHLVLGQEDRLTTYLPPSGLTARRNTFVYVQNLYRKPRLVFVAALQFGRHDLARAKYTLDGAPGRDDAFAVAVRHGRATHRVQFDLGTVQVSVG